MKYVLLIILLMGVFVYVAARPTKAEYHHCMVTTIDHAICESVNPTYH
jgi:hypothetical protein